MSALANDLRFAVRMLLKRPLFTVVAAAALALGIGATTTIFSLVNAVLLRGLPVDEPERVVSITAMTGDGTGFHAFSYPQYRDLRERSRSVEAMASYTDEFISFGTGGEPERLFATIAGCDYFTVLGLVPAAGRFFGPEDDRLGAGRPVVVISHSLWQHRFGGRASTIGRSVMINGERFTIVGVAPEGFTGLMTGAGTSVWLPSAVHAIVRPGVPEMLTSRNLSGLQIIARLREGVTRQQADAELDNVERAIAREHPKNSGGHGVLVEQATGMPGSARGEVTSYMGILMIVSGLVLVIACVNVASMLMARSVSRRHEIAIRLAMGAARGRVVRQLLIESLLLFLVGAAAGVLLSVWSLDVLLTLKPPVDIPIELDISVDATVLLFTLALTLVTGVLFGLAPALRASRPDLAPSLKEAGPAARGGRSRMRSTFIVVQVGLSLVLLVAAGLFLRALDRVHGIDPGFDEENVEVVAIDAALHGYDDRRTAQLYDGLLERVRALPGVESASMSKLLPLGMSSMVISTFVEGDERAPEHGHATSSSRISGGFFGTLRIPLVAGRDFTSRDRADAPRVVIVNEEFARVHFGGSALGRRVSFDGPSGPWMEIVGVAATVHYSTRGEAPRPYIYEPMAQVASATDAHLLVRRRAGLASAIPLVRREMKALDANLPLVGAASLSTYTAMSLLPQRLAAGVAGAFGLLGLVLAGVGIYGLVAYSVAQRTHELGIRTALGATRRQLLLMVVRQGMIPVGIGVALGLAAAVAVSRLLESFLLGLSSTDAVTYVVVPLVLAAVALVATVVPARRATRVEVMGALRYE